MSEVCCIQYSRPRTLIHKVPQYAVLVLGLRPRANTADLGPFNTRFFGMLYWRSAFGLVPILQTSDPITQGSSVCCIGRRPSASCQYSRPRNLKHKIPRYAVLALGLMPIQHISDPQPQGFSVRCYAPRLVFIGN